MQHQDKIPQWGYRKKNSLDDNLKGEKTSKKLFFGLVNLFSNDDCGCFFTFDSRKVWLCSSKMIALTPHPWFCSLSRSVCLSISPTIFFILPKGLLIFLPFSLCCPGYSAPLLSLLPILRLPNQTPGVFLSVCLRLPLAVVVKKTTFSWYIICFKICQTLNFFC